MEMGKAKIAVTIDERILSRLDRLVRQEAFVNRSQAVESALRDKLEHFDRTRLARELAKLDPHHEKSLAEEGISRDGPEWPGF
jgi:metal-responsive CopG/Arc/MetJ family transcriptional regulator